MKLLLASLLLAIGCTNDIEDLGEVQSASTPVGGQGSWYNGSWYNGSWYNSGLYNGSWYNGSWYNNATYGGTTLPDAASIQNGTALVIWTKKSGKWQQRFPDKICTWDGKRQKNLGCVTVDPAKDPSPLAGASFAGTFAQNNGAGPIINGTIYIGTATPQPGVVARDTTSAMHPLTGASTAQLIPYGTSDAVGATCGNKNGCRVNSDIWLYSLKLWDPSTSTYHDFCPGGGPATALAGTWDATGKYTSSSTSFTFACTTGTIEKCVRWGYRPWASAQKHCDRPAAYGSCTPTTDTTMYPLADYHQACVRAATADYCANGHSFTKNGTIVDIHDYYPTKDSWGFLPAARTQSQFDATGVFWEASFDKLGAVQIDHTRYQDQSATFGTVEEQCPGVIENAGSDDVLCPYGASGAACLARTGPDGPGLPQGPTAIVDIDSAPSCSHNEAIAGKFLHSHCSACTLKMHFNNAATAYCSDATDTRGWDSYCAAQSLSLCTSTQRMAVHNECSTGAGLELYDSGCTLAVCMDAAYASCCTPGASNWTSACVARANGVCQFAKKGGNQFLGYCDWVNLQGSTTGTNAP